MDKRQAEQLHILVNSPQWAVYLEYMEQRLSKAHRQLEGEDEKQFRKTQGAIAEIRNSLKLKETVDFVLSNNT